MFNESARIGQTVADVCATLEAWHVPAEVLLIDDGSSDATYRTARGLCGQIGLVSIRLLRHEANQGKGAAVRTGMRAATGSWVLFMDADNSTRLIELEKLNAEARRTGAPIIIASRAVGDSVVVTSAARRFAGRAFHTGLALLGMDLARDTQCGFKLYRADAARLISAQSVEGGFAFDVEHLLLARKAGMEVREVGVCWDHQPGGSIRVMRDGPRMLAAALRIRARVARLAVPPWRSAAGYIETKPLSLPEVQPHAAALAAEA